MAPESTVFHGVPGTSYSFHDEPLKDVQAHLAAVREWLAAEVVPVLVAAGARHEVHLFVDRTTAPAADVAATITSVADAVDAPLIVMAKSNKTLLDKVFVGSVADKVSKSGRNVMLVH